MDTRQDNIDFFNDFDRRLNQPDYDKFEKGRKLYLEVEVEDTALSCYLLKWLYARRGNKEDGYYKLFGCRLHGIYFTQPVDPVIKEIEQVIERYKCKTN